MVMERGHVQLARDRFVDCKCGLGSFFESDFGDVWRGSKGMCSEGLKNVRGMFGARSDKA